MAIPLPVSHPGARPSSSLPIAPDFSFAHSDVSFATPGPLNIPVLGLLTRFPPATPLDFKFLVFGVCNFETLDPPPVIFKICICA